MLHKSVQRSLHRKLFTLLFPVYRYVFILAEMFAVIISYYRKNAIKYFIDRRIKYISNDVIKSFLMGVKISIWNRNIWIMFSLEKFKIWSKYYS